MDFTQWVGIAASAGTGIGMMPQLIKVVKEKDAQTIAVGTVLTLLSGTVLWIVYGMMKDDWIIIISNGISTGINVSLLVLKYVYREK